MTWNDFLFDVRECATQAIEDGFRHTYADDYDMVHSILRAEDSITGAASGSYSCDREIARETIQGIVDDPEVLDKFLALGYTELPLDDPEIVEVIVRQLALDEQYELLESIFRGE